MRSLFILAALSAFSQEVTFRSTVPVVLLPVTVTDAKGRFVDGLQLADFAVTDNGQPQKITMETADATTAPIALVIAIQNNDLAGPALLKIKKIGSMMQPLVTGERGVVAVLTYGDGVQTALEFSKDANAITSTFAGLRSRYARKATAIDAAAQAMQMLADRKPGERRTLLLIGESKDRGSKNKLEAVAEQAQREGIAIYSATYSVTNTQFTTKGSDMPQPGGANTDLLAGLGELGRLGKTNTADAFAAATGGRKIGFATVHALEGLISKFGEELHSQYLLSFPAAVAPEGFHTVEVQVKQAGVKVRTRPGYWAVTKP